MPARSTQLAEHFAERLFGEVDLNFLAQCSLNFQFGFGNCCPAFTHRSSRRRVRSSQNLALPPSGNSIAMRSSKGIPDSDHAGQTAFHAQVVSGLGATSPPSAVRQIDSSRPSTRRSGSRAPTHAPSWPARRLRRTVPGPSAVEFVDHPGQLVIHLDQMLTSAVDLFHTRPDCVHPTRCVLGSDQCTPRRPAMLRSTRANS